MAKTLIGNIKGKDGRGISKIEKTATAGAVDTYTITYTDGTKSTYTIKNADEITLQRQIVPSASVEASNIASQAYTAGDYVAVNGVLRKVKSAIAKGNTISDSNSTATTVTDELDTFRSFSSRLYASNVNDLNNPPSSFLLNTDVNPTGMPSLGSNSCLVLQHNPGTKFSAQIAFSFGSDKLAIRRRSNSNTWSSWRYVTFS